MNKRKIADLLRTGLATSNVVEEPFVYIASRTEGASIVEANTIGIALIGVIGIEKTLKMAIYAYPGKESEEAASAEIGKLLGIETWEAEDLIMMASQKSIAVLVEEFSKD